MLAASYPAEGPPGVPVPLVELFAHGLLLLSLVGAFLGIAFRRHTREFLVANTWEPLPKVDVAVRLFTAVAAVDVLAALAAFAIMS